MLAADGHWLSQVGQTEGLIARKQLNAVSNDQLIGEVWRPKTCDALMRCVTVMNHLSRPERVSSPVSWLHGGAWQLLPIKRSKQPWTLVLFSWQPGLNAAAKFPNDYWRAQKQLPSFFLPGSYRRLNHWAGHFEAVLWQAFLVERLQQIRVSRWGLVVDMVEIGLRLHPIFSWQKEPSSGFGCDTLSQATATSNMSAVIQHRWTGSLNKINHHVLT